MYSSRILFVFALLLTLAGCNSAQPLKPVDQVDLEHFMGDWYVIANIPTRIETTAHNALESYRMDSDGTIATTFTFRDGAFNGELKTYNPRGFVSEESNAIWGMQFVWPFKADYRIVYLDEGYTTTIIGRNKRDYVWLMSRKPEMAPKRYAELVDLIASMGYDVSQIYRVPQQW